MKCSLGMHGAFLDSNIQFLKVYKKNEAGFAITKLLQALFATM